MNYLKESDSSRLKAEIIQYLKSKEKIRAVLFHKLLKKFCNKRSQLKVRKAELISCLTHMMKERIIEIIIPDLFEVSWELKYLSDLSYLQDGDYYIRKFSQPSFKDDKLKSKDNYIFDSRSINFENRSLVDRTTKWLENVIKSYSKIKYKIMIYYPINSRPLKIYDLLKDSYKLSFQNFSPPEELIKKAKKIKIDVDEQKSDLFLIQSYRKNYMCFYITLIESIQYAIMNLLSRGIKEHNFDNKLKELINKFGYYCELFVNSDWVEILQPNPYRWETFFIKFGLPFKILNLEHKTIRFHRRTFECWIKYRYCVFINRNDFETITLLKKIGYQEFFDQSNEETIAIGGNHEVFIPCPSIEHFFFIFKYICYYNLFLLFFHTFSYLKKTLMNFKLTTKDQELYKTFLPVIEPLFGVKNKRISKRLVFSYYTLNPDELEIIYNKFLINKIRIIEKKLFNYFLLRCSL
jgi:hypothetical protein